MSTIVQSYDASNNAVYPVTHFRAVRDSSGTTLESMMQDVREMAVGYYECSTPGSTAAKTITTDSSVSLSTKILCKVKFVEKNTVNNATMDINGTGAKALYYNGVRAAANNSWYPNEVVDLYYDGTNYQAKSCADTLEYDVSLHQTHEITEITKTTRTLVFNGNVVSSWESETSISDSSVEGYTRSETNTGQDVDSTTVDGPNATYDSSANRTNVVYVTTHTYTHVVNNYTFQEAVNAVPMSYRHGGLKLRFISNGDSFVQSSDNKYVQFRLMADSFSNIASNWQGVDDEPTAGSDNLVKSRGVAGGLSQLGQYSNEETRYTDLYTDQIYNLNISVGNTPTLTPGATSGWSCVSFSVNAGDIVKIKAVGNVYSGRPYAILGEGNVVLKCAKDDDVSVADTEMIMPEGAKGFYANFKKYDASTQGVWKYVIVTVKQKIAEVDNRSLSNSNKIENIYGYFDVRNWISGYFYQADVRIGEGSSVNYECCKVPTSGLKEIHFSVYCPSSRAKCTLVDTEFNILEQWTGNVNEDIYLSEYPNAAFLYVSNYITNTNRYVKVVPSQSNPLLTQLERIKALGALPLSYSNPSSSGYLPVNFINPLCFLHISDTHWHAGYVNTVKNAVELLNSIKLNQTSGVATREILRFLIHTGDVAADTFTSDFNHYKNVVLESTKPCFLVIGNHDVGGSHKDIATSGTDAQVYEKMIEPFLQSWNLNNDGGGIAHPDGKCYYFNDFTTEKIRMIVLDAYETNFETVDGQLKYKRGENGYTQDQITWFGNALVGTPSGYGVIIAKHAPCGTIGKSESPFNSSVDFGASYEANNDFIPAIVQAFKNGDNLSLNPISATFNPIGGKVQCVTDFSQKNANVEFICHLNGHTHKDHVYYVPNYPTQLNLGVGCDSTYSTIDADTAHVEGTLSENLINAYAIDRNKGVVRIVRLGADISFEFQDRRFTQIPYRI